MICQTRRYRTVDLLDEIKLCNCAGCRSTLLGRTTLVAPRRLGEYAGLPRVRGYIAERPYCETCYWKLKAATC